LFFAISSRLLVLFNQRYLLLGLTKAELLIIQVLRGSAVSDAALDAKDDVLEDVILDDLLEAVELLASK
jgi:hypothetical protein